MRVTIGVIGRLVRVSGLVHKVLNWGHRDVLQKFHFQVHLSVLKSAFCAPLSSEDSVLNERSYNGGWIRLQCIKLAGWWLHDYEKPPFNSYWIILLFGISGSSEIEDGVDFILYSKWLWFIFTFTVLSFSFYVSVT